MRVLWCATHFSLLHRSTGSPPSKVYGHMRAIANRAKERL